MSSRKFYPAVVVSKSNVIRIIQYLLGGLLLFWRVLVLLVLLGVGVWLVMGVHCVLWEVVWWVLFICMDGYIIDMGVFVFFFWCLIFVVCVFHVKWRVGSIVSSDSSI